MGFLVDSGQSVPPVSLVAGVRRHYDIRSGRCRRRHSSCPRASFRPDRVDAGALGPRNAARRAARRPDWPGDRAAGGRGERQVGRITFEILRPVPIAPPESRPASPAPDAAWSCGGRTLRRRARADPRQSLAAAQSRCRASRRSEPDGPGRIGTCATSPGFSPGVSSAPRLLPPDRPGRRVAHRDGVSFIRGDFGIPAPRWSGCACATRSWRRGALAAQPGPGRRRLGQRRQRGPRLAQLPFHQRRPEGPPSPHAFRRMGVPGRADAARAHRRRSRRHPALGRARTDRAGAQTLLIDER